MIWHKTNLSLRWFSIFVIISAFFVRTENQEETAWRWTEQIRQLVTGPRVSLAGQQMPLQLSPRSSSLKYGRRPKSTRFQLLDPPRKLQKGTFFGRKNSSQWERWGCPGLWVVVLTSLVWAARSGPLLQSYWADRPASSLVRLFLTLYTTPSLSLESSTQRQINRNAFAFPCLGFHSLPSPEDCFTVVSKSLSTRCLSPLPFLGKGDLSWPTDTARQILPSLSSLDKIQYLETKEYLHGCPLFSCICYSL